MKRVVALILTMALSISLAGCTSSTDADNSSKEDQNKTGNTSTDNSEEKITLTFMRTGTPEQLHPIFDPIIEQYEKENPNINIDMVDLGWSDAEKTIQTMASSKTLPDVMYHLPGTIFDLGEKGLVEDLASYLDDELKEDMYPAMLDAGKYNDKQYMVACGGSTAMLWYNTKLFEEAGLDPNNPPKTWDEFLDACEKLDAIEGISPVGTYAKSNGGETSFIYESLFTSAYGKSAWDSSNNQYAYDSDEGKDAAIMALQFMQDITKFSQNSYVEYGRFDTRTLMRDSKVAMGFDLIHMANQIPNQLASGEIKVTSLPAGNGGNNSSAVNVGGWFIPSHSVNKDEAWKFLRYLMETENQLEHSKYGSIPMLKSEAATYTEGYMVDVVKTIEHSYPEGVSVNSNALWTVTGEELQLLLMGNQTAEETQAKIASGHNEIYNE